MTNEKCQMTNEKIGFLKNYAPLSKDSGAFYRPVAPAACGTANSNGRFLFTDFLKLTKQAGFQ